MAPLSDGPMGRWTICAVIGHIWGRGRRSAPQVARPDQQERAMGFPMDRWTDGPMDRWTDVRPWANGARWRDSLVIFGAQVAGQTKRERAMGFPMDRWTDEPMADGRSRLVLCHWSYLEAKSPGLARAE